MRVKLRVDAVGDGRVVASTIIPATLVGGSFMQDGGAAHVEATESGVIDGFDVYWDEAGVSWRCEAPPRRVLVGDMIHIDWMGHPIGKIG